jgi:hypothetical protein
MRRREFIASLGGAVAWPLAAQAQQLTLPTIGLLGVPRTGRRRFACIPARPRRGGLRRGQECHDRILLGKFQFDRAQVASYESRQPYQARSWLCY